MEKLIEDRIKEIMSKVFNVSVDEIDSRATPRTTNNWNGKTHYKMVEALEKQFGVKFEESEVEILVSYKIIVATIEAYLS